MAWLLFPSRCHEEGGDQPDRPGRPVRLRSATTRERERSPPRVPLLPRGAPGTRRIIYISPRTYLPVARTPRKYTAFFYDSRKREREGERDDGGGRGSARAMRGSSEGKSRPLLSSCPSSLFHPRESRFSFFLFLHISLFSLFLSLFFFFVNEGAGPSALVKQSCTPITTAVAACRMYALLPYTYFRAVHGYHIQFPR